VGLEAAAPHFVAVSPYDAEKHVWVVDDHKHVIHKFSHDGKTEVQTIGTYGEPGADDKHFNRPTFIDWFPDGGFVVATATTHAVVKFDKSGKYVTAWGQKGTRRTTRARLLQQRPRHRGRSADEARVRQRPRQPPRAGLR